MAIQANAVIYIAIHLDIAGSSWLPRQPSSVSQHMEPSPKQSAPSAGGYAMIGMAPTIFGVVTAYIVFTANVGISQFVANI